MSSPSPMQPDVYYHVFNRGNNGANVFFENRNYSYFMDLYTKYIEPVAATYAYCLMRNHFHLFLRVYTHEEKVAAWQRLYPDRPFKEIRASQAFSNMFNAYAKAIQKAYGRTGSVFEHPYHRIPVTADGHLARLIPYIHKNPEKHGFVQDFRDWRFSSYHSLVTSQPTQLQRDVVLGWFSGIEGFRQAHVVTDLREAERYMVEGDDF